jgi:GT2 family glycosyltransferase
MISILQLNAGWERDGEPAESPGFRKVARYIESLIAIQDGDQPAPRQDWQVDIVVPIYGQPQLLKRCVDSLLRTVSGAQVILVNDASPDPAIRPLLDSYSAHPQVTVIHNPENLGFIGATKLGARQGQAPFILFLNSDVEALEPGWLDRMIPSEEDVAIVGAKLLYPPVLPNLLAGKVQHAGVARLSGGWPYHPYLGRQADLPR